MQSHGFIYRMAKVGVNWTISLDIVSKLIEEGKKSGRTVSFLADHYLRKVVKAQTPNDFFACRICGDLGAPKLDDLCPECFAELQKREKEKSEKEFQKIMDVKTVEKEKQDEEIDIKKKQLNYEIKRIKLNLEDNDKLIKSTKFEDVKKNCKDGNIRMRKRLALLEKELEEYGK